MRRYVLGLLVAGSLAAVLAPNLVLVMTLCIAIVGTILGVQLLQRFRGWRNIWLTERLKVPYFREEASSHFVRKLLEKAREQSKDGPVAHYLVGAKLRVRFRDSQLENRSYSTADQLLGRPGDFQLGDTVFHVTVAPAALLYEKCRRNLDEGLRVYVLVPESELAGAKQLARHSATGRITVEAVEDFVGQNVDELSRFSASEQRTKLLRLLETYNQRVDVVENDKSMLIEIPSNLRVEGS